MNDFLPKTISADAAYKLLFKNTRAICITFSVVPDVRTRGPAIHRWPCQRLDYYFNLIHPWWLQFKAIRTEGAKANVTNPLNKYILAAIDA